MSKQNNSFSYRVANTFLLRAPLLPLHTLKELSDADDVDAFLRTYYSGKEVAEALFLASPELYRATKQWIEDGTENEKIRFSLMKYLVRMSSRCTPFGAFAGICSGSFSENSKITLASLGDNKLFMRPDMQFLCSLAEKILGDRNLREGLIYSPNTSLFSVGDEYRYVEYQSDDDGMRHYKLQSVRGAESLNKIIARAETGATLSDLYAEIIEENLDLDEAREYIHMLIDNQVLVSSLDPGLTGEGYFDELKNGLEEINTDNAYLKLLQKISDSLLKMQSSKRHSKIKILGEMIMDVGKSAISFRENELIQADLKLVKEDCSLSSHVRHDIEDIIPVLGILSRAEGNALMDSFMEKFIRRYDAQEVPLSMALDAEAGLGYLPDDQHANASSLIEGLRLPQKDFEEAEIKWTAVDSMLYRKLQSALMEGGEIEIKDDDLQMLPEMEQNLPVSISVMARILTSATHEQEKCRFLIESAGGISALNLAGRFGHMDDRLKETMEGIAEFEQSFYDEHILAEIVHLPQQRTGNVLLRPVLHKYEIPYLARAAVPDEYCIPIRDLMVSVGNNRVRLRSKKLNKYIIPRLSNAHNYAFSSLSVYRFLCDLQSRDTRAGIGFSWGSLQREAIYLPRVIHKNFILARACWNLTSKELSEIQKIQSLGKLMKAIEMLRNKYLIPQEIVLTDSDNELWIDLASRNGAELFQYEIRKRKHINLQEFLQPDCKLVQSVDGCRANEFIFFLTQEG